MSCSNTAWTRVLPGLFGASMVCTAWADAPPARPPEAVRHARSSPCNDDVESIRAQIRLHGSITASDEQAPYLRRYQVRDLKLHDTLARQARCKADCTGAPGAGLPGTPAQPGRCRWLPGQWGATMRFQGGCAHDAREMGQRIDAHGAVRAADAAHPERDPLLVSAVDDAAAAVEHGACAAACTVSGTRSGMCQWKLFDWAGSLAAEDSPGTACLGDYHDIQEQILDDGCISVPGARDTDSALNRVHALRGAPSLSEGVCTVGCAKLPGLVADCTWTLRQWRDTIRYHWPRGAVGTGTVTGTSS